MPRQRDAGAQVLLCSEAALPHCQDAIKLRDKAHTEAMKKTRATSHQGGAEDEGNTSINGDVMIYPLALLPHKAVWSPLQPVQQTDTRPRQSY
jgi:hypothetical protein